MRKVVGTLAVIAFLPIAGYATAQIVDGLRWAYPVNPPPGAANADAAEAKKTVNPNQIATSYTGLPTAPPIVYAGKPLPCMQCHLANGNSRPESADISGLSVNYIMEQVHAYRAEQRVDLRTKRMVAASKLATDAELLEAAKYYSAIPRERRQWIKTIVSDEAPKGDFTFGPGSFKYKSADNAMEPLPQGRVVMQAADNELVDARDQNLGSFVQYVRADDLALGERLATTGGGKTLPCATCHGVDFKGQGDVPHLAGRGTLYMIRAMNDIRIGANTNPKAAIMKPVVANLSDREIVALAAYMASREP
jgi:cytochrome c553